MPERIVLRQALYLPWERRQIMTQPAISEDLISAHGLNSDEYAEIIRLLDREPSFTELGIFSAMWNEHCSYKSSKRWLRTLPTTGPQVICGPGENAGVVDIGDGQAVVFKMESHNHPSYIEPYQGAATGMGGILRDVFTMGARPIAAMNSLSFGATDHPKTKQLVHGVVSGIGGYGNCFGVPTVGGEVRFDPAYNGNCLVNAFAAGLADSDKIFYSAASGVGMPVVYLGAKTGRDGVGGATMASAEFDDTIPEYAAAGFLAEDPNPTSCAFFAEPSICAFFFATAAATLNDEAAAKGGGFFLLPILLLLFPLLKFLYLFIVVVGFFLLSKSVKVVLLASKTIFSIIWPFAFPPFAKTTTFGGGSDGLATSFSTRCGSLLTSDFVFFFFFFNEDDVFATKGKTMVSL